MESMKSNNQEQHGADIQNLYFYHMNLHEESVGNTPKNGNINNFDLMTDNDDFDRESSGKTS